MIFVSYAREDHAYVRFLEREMHSAAIPFLRDATLMASNPFWRNHAVHQLHQCSIMIVISSCHSWTSPWVEQEIRAFDGLKLIVPLDDFPVPTDRLHCSPYRLVSRDLILDQLEQLRQLSLLAEASFPEGYFAERETSELQAQRLRHTLIASEEVRLFRFLSTLGKKAPIIECCGDVVLNRVDGSQLRRVPVRPQTCTRERITYIGVEPITNAQYSRFLHANGFAPPPTWERADFTLPDAPVVGVNWFEARAYALWARGDFAN